MRNYEKNISGCAIIGFLNEDGKRVSGEDILAGISVMHERSNGLGGGFAAYGIYPEYKDHYAFHLMYDNTKAFDETTAFIEENFHVEKMEKIPHTHIPEIVNHPLLRRYFVKPRSRTNIPIFGGIYEDISDDEFVARAVFKINSEFEGAFVFSSGKNCGSFKAVGYPEDVGKFYKLESYKGYCWMAHGRFPTNSQAWWGGAHPFSLLDYSVVHNGEISSYGINKRYLENHGYNCVAGTDTEVIAYLFDLFNRKQGLDFETVADILAAPFWKQIDHMPQDKKQYFYKLRAIYASALLTGPFGICVGFTGGMLGLNDRTKLRPLIAARTENRLYLSSEESAIHETNRFGPLKKIWAPKGGELIIGRVKNMEGLI